MAEFKLERFKYSWKGAWTGSTEYKRDDIVKVGGKSYVCLITHTSDADFNVDLEAVVPGSSPPIPAPKWIVMTDSRSFVGNWATATIYNRGDIVQFDGSLWLCIDGHTSTDFASDYTNWEVFAQGIKFKADWGTSIGYGPGALVKYNGIVYKCINPHTSAGSINDNIDDWEVFFDGVEYAGNLQPLTTYRVNDLIKFGGSIFKVIEEFTSSEEGIDDTKVQMLLPGFQFDGDWVSTTAYSIGDVVRYGGYMFYCTNNNIGIDPFVRDEDSSNYWSKLALTYNFRGTWSEAADYKPGDIVQRGGDLYLAKYEVGGYEQDGSSLDYLDTDVWEKIAPGAVWGKENAVAGLGSTDGTTVRYNVEFSLPREGDIGNKYVIAGEYRATLKFYENYTYIFNQDALENVYFPNANGTDPNPHPLNFSADNPNGEREGGTGFLSGVTYYLDDEIVTYSDYNDTTNFQAATNRRVEIFITPQTPRTLYYWCWNHEDMGNTITVDDEPVLSGNWTADREYLVNEVVYYLGTAYKCNTQHLSADDNFPGDNGSGYYYWDTYIERGSSAGLNDKGDLLTYGLNRTLAGDQSSLGPVALPIGEEREVLSINTDQEAFWRARIQDSDTIFVGQNGMDLDGYGLSPDRPFATVKHACEYVEDNFTAGTPTKVYVATGNFIESGPISIPAGCVVMGDELRATKITANDPFPDYAGDDYITKKLYIQHLLTFLDDLFQNRLVTTTPGNNIFQDRSVPAVGSDPTETVVELIDFHDEYLDYWLGSGIVNPTVVGTNTATVDTSYLDAVDILEKNKNFIANEIFAWLRFTQPTYTFDENRIRRDIYHFLRAVKHDLIYTGNHRTILHCRDFKNKALGSQFDDLFYIRDTTGVRNCTINGLRGTLNPPGVFDLYQRPTGGACVSLDPGWGPDDESVWIKNRSPYIQGVTNIGSNCVGQKIDGSLHNGGLKSCTSNDFTQVLSDGVGAWITNGGRAELVSVFTYYCVIGYLADEGGTIRATNGNNSYGVFGAIADGFDPTETPQTAFIDNQSQNEATVESVFAGEFTDQIFALEYNHCGEEYSQAQADIVGAGINASVEFNDFRSGGLYNVRIINSDGSGAIGGSGYRLQTGNAQTGDSTTITLDTGSGFDEVDILGQRVIIISGDGTGQYGYVQAYNPGTKICTVYKESTDTIGWDHIVPGTTIETLLTSNTQYRIEPRVVCDPPPTSGAEYSLPQIRPYEDVQFGQTTSIFTGLQMDPGSGEVDGIAASPAVFNLTRSAQTYTIEFTDEGAGYVVGDQTVISGSALGGTAGVNDCTITVTAVTEDSTNSIVSVSVLGTGIGGKYVAISDPNFFSYSDNGQTWTEGNLPFVSTWIKVVNGNNRFFALPTEESDQFGLSLDGINWERKTVGPLAEYSDIIYGGGKFVAIAENSNTTIYSSDGDTWAQGTIPDDALGDSTASQWLYLAYGNGKYVAVSGNDSASATSSDGDTWLRHTGLPAGSNDWVGLAFGRGRFVLLARTGELYYSFDGITWTSGGDMVTQDGSTSMNWTKLKYENGLFVALCDTTGLTIGADASDGTTNFFATSQDGILWTGKTFPGFKIWGCITHGPAGYVALSKNATLNGVAIVQTGATALLRSDVGSNAFDSVKIWDCGSGYDAANPPSITVTANPDVTVELATEQRIGSTGTIGAPDWINRGQGYRSSSTVVTLTGNGYADNFPVGNDVVLTGVSVVPGPGAQIRFDVIPDEDTPDPDDKKLFAAVGIVDLGDDGTGNGTNRIRLTVSPKVELADNVPHESEVEIRLRYSQCRISGHDFLDIGTGNFEETNYPEIYADGNYFVSAPENEVYEENGGRVFYTSSDQDGNFRAGELFSVQQATGIVTISAEFFNLDGLSELALGGVRLGGSGAVVREFSTDVNFTEDSNNVVPTQRAVITFLANRLSEGGSELETNQLTAGRVLLGGENNEIRHSLGGIVEIPVLAIFEGTGDPLNPQDSAQVSGLMQAYPLYFRTVDESIQ